MEEKTFVCRCEDVTEEEVLEAIREGATTLEELKRILRIGMGPCQGRTCGPIVRSILARELKKQPSEIKDSVVRPPLKPVPASTFLKEQNNE